MNRASCQHFIRFCPKVPRILCKFYMPSRRRSDTNCADASMCRWVAALSIFSHIGSPIMENMYARMVLQHYVRTKISNALLRTFFGRWEGTLSFSPASKTSETFVHWLDFIMMRALSFLMVALKLVAFVGSYYESVKLYRCHDIRISLFGLRETWTQRIRSGASC